MGLIFRGANMDPIAKIREKSREQWTALVTGWIDEIRIWIEDNGVKASALALVFGMVIILLFKIVVFLVVVGGLSAFFVWSVSIPEAEAASSKVASTDITATVVEITPEQSPSKSSTKKDAKDTSSDTTHH